MATSATTHLTAVHFTSANSKNMTAASSHFMWKSAPFRVSTWYISSMSEGSVLRVNPVANEVKCRGIAKEGKEKKLKDLKVVVEEDEKVEGRTMEDYFDLLDDLIKPDGGPPRWFSPLESASQMNNAPLLLYLPGLDGNGHGLILQHQKLGKMFDIWCLHIPIIDQTPFQDLVRMVEKTVRSENHHLPNRPIYLVGESVGACISLSVAAHCPDIDIVLILANPGTSYSNSNLQKFSTILGTLPDELCSIVPHVLSLISGHQVLGKIFSKETLLWKLNMVESASAYTNTQLPICTAQTLILASGKDQLLPSKIEARKILLSLPKCEVRLYASCRKHPNCEIRTFNDAGHFLFWDVNIDLADIIKGASFYRRARSHDFASDYLMPSQSEFKKISKGFRWIDVATGPVMLSTLEDGKIVRGLEGIPSDGPVLYVGYHMLMGIEIYPLVCTFFKERQILLRGMTHPLLFVNLQEDTGHDISMFDVFRTMGAAPCIPQNLYKLLASKSHILLYPGGMREALHRKGEEYQLFWPKRSEFVRMAAKFGAKIIPFGVVGEDDVTSLVFDYNDQMKIPYLRGKIEKSRTDFVRLRTDMEGEEVGNQDTFLPGILPKFPGRFYFLFGKPIDTSGREEELRNKDRAQDLYLQVKFEVERNIAYLKEKRKNDPYRSLFSRLIYQATRTSATASDVPTFEL